MATNKLTWVPDFWDMVFSIKTFAAAVLALFIALCFDLPNPYWAFTTVYIVANPLSGASTSKAAYRLIGTAVGGAVTIVLVPNLVNSPELLTLAVALWVGGCLAVSLLDRTPRSYSFMLAGYTVALASFPLVANPENAFTYATSRVIEISVAIISTALINRLVFPRHAGPILASRIDAWLKDGSSLVVAALEGRSADPTLAKTTRRLAAEAADIRMFTTHVSYDTSTHRQLVGRSRELQGLMVTLLPVISGLADVQLAMARAGHLPTDKTERLIKEITSWLNSGDALPEEQRLSLLAQLTALERQANASSDWQGLLILDFSAHLRDVLQIWSDCLALRQEIASGARYPRSRFNRRFGENTERPIHRDYGMALFSGFSAALAIILGTAFWIMTGWSSGGGAPVIAGILICFFATMDNPTPIIRKFLTYSLFAMALSFIFIFSVMPLLNGFSSLALALAFLFLPLGLLIAKPSTFLIGMGISTNIPTMLTLQSRPSLDLASFLNTNLATVLGTILALGVASIVRSVGSEWSARRLLRAGWADISGAARRSQTPDLQRLLHRMLDRISLLAPRLASIPGDSPILASDMLKDTRVGINVIGLQGQKGLLLRDERQAVDAVLDAIGTYYRDRRRLTAAQPGRELLVALDKSLDAVQSPAGSSAAQATRMALVALRHNLFPYAPEFRAVRPDALGQAAE